jgi:hypothetical protein
MGVACRRDRGGSWITRLFSNPTWVFVSASRSRRSGPRQDGTSPAPVAAPRDDAPRGRAQGNGVGMGPDRGE